MAALLEIQQHSCTRDGIRKVTKTFTFYNTSLEDETILIKKAFLPLYAFQDKLSKQANKVTDKIFKRFFEEGMFLSIQDIANLNKYLKEINHPIIQLINDGKYSQPVCGGDTRPSSSAWKANAVARSAEMQVAVNGYKVKANEYAVRASNLEAFIDG